MELPVEYQNRMASLLKEEYPDYLASLQMPPVRSLRVNTDRISPERFSAVSPFTLSPVPWCGEGFYYGRDDEPGKHPFRYEGLYYMQEASAMLPASLMPVEAGDVILDACAAPGGKTTALACRLRKSGLLISNDISASRQNATLQNVQRFGLVNTCIISEDLNTLAPRFPSFFDRILIDVPCSGEGMFRRDPSLIESWKQKGPAYYAPLQKQIASSALAMLKPGGTLVYSTCTFSPEEDEEVILYMKEICPGLEILPSPVSCEGFAPGILPGTENCIRLYPHRVTGEGHFAALLKKPGGRIPSPAPSHTKTFPLNEDVLSFLQLLEEKPDPGRIVLRNEKVILLPEKQADLTSLRTVREGLLLGTLKHGRFEPAQHLAQSLSSSAFRRSVSFPRNDPRIVRFLRGETVKCESSVEGWILVCDEEFPLGFGKIKNGTIKNKIEAGARML